MKLKNAVAGMAVSVKMKKTDDLISGHTFDSGDICWIDGVDRDSPQLKLANAQGYYLGWLDAKDVRILR